MSSATLPFVDER
jgi:hypothetical protein